MDFHIQHLFGNLFRERFKEYINPSMRRVSFCSDWDLYKKTHNIKTKLNDETGYCDVILNPLGGHYYVPETFITQVASLKYVPPIINTPEIDINKLTEAFRHKHKEIKDFNAKVRTHSRQDRNWNRYLGQLECVEWSGPYSSGGTYYKKKHSGEKIELGSEFDYVWIAPNIPVNNDECSLFGVEFEKAQNFIQNGLPDCDFELERFKPNYRMMPQYQPW